MDRAMESFRRLHELVVESTGVEAFVHEMTQLAAEVVVPPAAASVTVIRAGQPMTMVSNDARTEGLDEAQYETDEGPCLSSLRNSERVEVPSVDLEERWPAWRRSAEEVEVRSALACPLQVGSETLGALNVYGFSRDAFNQDEIRLVEIFAAQAAGALAILHRSTSQAETLNDLENALSSRAVIDQAIGILMAQQRCSAERAMELLRAHATNSNTKLRDVAAGLVARVGGEPAPSSSGFRRRED